MCPQCSGLAPIVELQYATAYMDLVGQLQAILKRDSLRCTKGVCALDAVQTAEGRWASDYIEHEFACTACGQGFRLGFETYHGSGGRWEPITGPEN